MRAKGKKGIKSLTGRSFLSTSEEFTNDADLQVFIIASCMFATVVTNIFEGKIMNFVKQ